MIQNQNLAQSKIINIMTNKKENDNSQLNFNFLQSSLQFQLQSSKKRVKMFVYCKYKIGHRGIFFLHKKFFDWHQKTTE